MSGKKGEAALESKENYAAGLQDADNKIKESETAAASGLAGAKKKKIKKRGGKRKKAGLKVATEVKNAIVASSNKLVERVGSLGRMISPLKSDKKESTTSPSPAKESREEVSVGPKRVSFVGIPGDALLASPPRQQQVSSNEFEVVDLSSPRKATSSKRESLVNDEESGEVICHEFLVSVASLGSSETTIFQDWLEVRSAEGSWRPRWVLVHNNVLYIFSSCNAARPSSIVILDQVNLEKECGEDPLALRLCSRTGRVMFLRAPNASMKAHWVNLLSTCRFEYQVELRERGKLKVGRSRTRSRASQAKTIADTSSTMFWSIFVLVQVCLQLSMDVASFLSRRPVRATAAARALKSA